MSTRRDFLTAGAVAPVLGLETLQAQTVVAAPIPLSEEISLAGRWRFRLDPENNGLSSGWHERDHSTEGWRDVDVPHTWQIEPTNTEYMGVAWYRRSFDVPVAWAHAAVRIEFEAVFHTATVWVNGTEVGRHAGKGYTQFDFDINPVLVYGAKNVIAVRVDNSFDDTMVPRGRSSDWAHDGGIYRPIRLLITPKVFIQDVYIDTEVDLTSASAKVSVSAILRNTSGEIWSGNIDMRLTEDDTGASVAAQAPAVTATIAPGESKRVALPIAAVEQPRLWHFDHPYLYRGAVRLSNGHARETTFGIRKVEIRGNRFYLNGEPVRLMGVERMAGSNPEFGMAEPSHWIDHDHRDMKHLNCVYTRVHWPQDRRVLDWCDRHGVFIQTEVPAWGPKTFEGMADTLDAKLMNNALEQLREMILRDRNHPCIFSWGVCNEINGQNPPAYAFAQRLYAEAKRLDPTRLVTYASHSLFHTPEKDVAGLMDYIMFNQYYGSWQNGGPQDLARTLDQIHRAFPDKALVISEYGYCACTPDRPEGDEKRIQVLETQDPVLRERDYIAGLIFFDYNDYRTHVGDRGTGALKQRVHGVVDVYGAPKASYATLRSESSPVEHLEVAVQDATIRVRLKTRSTAPSYTLHGYEIRAIVYGQGNIPVERLSTPIRTLGPGSEFAATMQLKTAAPLRIDVDTMRPTGFSVASATWS